MQFKIQSMEFSIPRDKLHDDKSQPENTSIFDNEQEISSTFLNPIVELLLNSYANNLFLCDKYRLHTGNKVILKYILFF